MRSLALVVIVCLALPALASRGASAIEPSSAACKKELQAAQKKMKESLGLITGAQNAPAADKCPAYSRSIDIINEIRESFARCEQPKARTEAVRDVDEVLDATQQAYEKWCPARPGMVRVRMTVVTHVTREKLPKPIAAVHNCNGDAAMFFTNERFDLGRLVTVGCPGAATPTPADAQARNTRVDLLQKEQAIVYVTRDKDGDDPRRLTFPILSADGSETTTDRLIAERITIGDKLDLISSYWEPAKDGVCRVHAVWRVADGKAKLVLWQEATDCSARPTEYKTVLDRR
jgi:hypothetical protein